MKSDEPFKRPTLTEALTAWKKLLAERGFATDIIWIFEENLCFEKSPNQPGGFQLGFQTQFSPPPADALDVAFEHFCETGRADCFLPARRVSRPVRLHFVVRPMVREKT